MNYKHEYITGLYYQYLGERKQVLADIDVYVSNPAGVGEHSDISAEVEKKVKQLGDINGVLTTLQSDFSDIINRSMEPKSAESL
jgi:hypothetical protein